MKYSGSGFHGKASKKMNKRPFCDILGNQELAQPDNPSCNRPPKAEPKN
jgi:hypothetical protein